MAAFAASPQSAAVPRIGYLGSVSAPTAGTPQHSFEAFREALAELGYVDGGNVIIESRWPKGGRPELLPDAAAELAGLRVDVICAVGGIAARAAKNATTTIPIVFAIVIDPVPVGLITNRERPGGNVTGFTTFDPQQARKQLSLLKEAIPHLGRVAILGDGGVGPALFHVNEQQAQALGLKAESIRVRAPNPDLDGAFALGKKEGAEALVALDHPVVASHRRLIAELAVRYQVPTLFARDHADAGGLLAYGTSLAAASRRAADYVKKILQGANPADLPVETVTRHELIINVKTARDIGVSIPPELLRRADQVIP